MSESKKEKLVNDIIDIYADNDLCMAEILAGETVPACVTYEEAFEVYIEAMKRVNGDEFYTIKEGERHEL